MEDFLPFLTRETAFVASCLLSGTPIAITPMIMGILRKEKNALNGTKFFPYREDPFSGGSKTIYESVFVHLKSEKVV